LITGIRKMIFRVGPDKLHRELVLKHIIYKRLF